MSRDDLFIEGQRVALRSFREDDVPLIEPWYSEAAAAVHGLSDVSIHGSRHMWNQIVAASAQSDESGGLLVITRSGEDAPIGLFDYRVDVPDDGDVNIYEVALAAAARRWGLGQEAVRLFEEEASRRWSVRRFCADVAIRHGLALYFWLRVGYRPMDVDGGTEGRSVVTMVREAGRKGAA